MVIIIPGGIGKSVSQAGGGNTEPQEQYCGQQRVHHTGHLQQVMCFDAFMHTTSGLKSLQLSKPHEFSLDKHSYSLSISDDNDNDDDEGVLIFL